MMKKTSLFTAIFLVFSSFIQAQEFFQSLGSSVSVMSATLQRASIRSQNRFAVTHAHINFFPRINFPMNDYSSFSLGAPLGIGAAFIDNDFMGIHKTFLSYDIPIVLDYNMGFKSNIDPGDDNIGFYFGVGFSMMKTQLDSIADTKFIPSSSGILTRAGLRLALPYSTKHHGMTMGLFYKFGMGEERFRTMGVNVLFDF